VNLWQQLERTAAAPPRAARARCATARAPRSRWRSRCSPTCCSPATPAAEFPLLDVGTVASEDVIAPFAFRVPKPEDDLRRERDAAAGAALPVLGYSPAAADSARLALRQFAGAGRPGRDSTLPLAVRVGPRHRRSRPRAGCASTRRRRRT
jgi:hypothetical protein